MTGPTGLDGDTDVAQQAGEHGSFFEFVKVIVQALLIALVVYLGATGWTV